jgi:hypothetical protein
MPREIITTYAILKRSAAIANHKGGWLDDEAYDLIVRVRDEPLEGIRARTISTASSPAPILAHTSGVAGPPRGRGLSDRARLTGCSATPSCWLLMRNRTQP